MFDLLQNVSPKNSDIYNLEWARMHFQVLFEIIG